MNQEGIAHIHECIHDWLQEAFLRHPRNKLRDIQDSAMKGTGSPHVHSETRLNKAVQAAGTRAVSNLWSRNIAKVKNHGASVVLLEACVHIYTSGCMRTKSGAYETTLKGTTM